MKEIYVVHHLGSDKKSVSFVDFDLCESYTNSLKLGTYHMQKISMCENKKDLDTIKGSTLKKDDGNSFGFKKEDPIRFAEKYAHLAGAVRNLPKTNIGDLIGEKYGVDSVDDLICD